MKAKAKFYKGIEYIVVSELPADQQALLEQKNIERIKILMEGKIISNCVSYTEYCEWFISTFKQRLPATISTQDSIKVKVAFNKA